MKGLFKDLQDPIDQWFYWLESRLGMLSISATHSFRIFIEAPEILRKKKNALATILLSNWIELPIDDTLTPLLESQILSDTVPSFKDGLIVESDQQVRTPHVSESLLCSWTPCSAFYNVVLGAHVNENTNAPTCVYIQTQLCPRRFSGIISSQNLQFGSSIRKHIIQ